MLRLELKNFMYKHDPKRLLQMAHQRYEQTNLEQWKHDDKWKKYYVLLFDKEKETPR